jgi:hypothetical protein
MFSPHFHTFFFCGRRCKATIKCPSSSLNIGYWKINRIQSTTNGHNIGPNRNCAGRVSVKLCYGLYERCSIPKRGRDFVFAISSALPLGQLRLRYIYMCVCIYITHKYNTFVC